MKNSNSNSNSEILESVYVRNLGPAYVFDTQEETERFAKLSGGEVVLLRKRDGWHEYKRYGLTSLPYEFSTDDMDYNDDTFAYCVMNEKELRHAYEEEASYFIEEGITVPEFPGDVLATVLGMEEGSKAFVIFDGKDFYVDEIFTPQQTRWHDCDVWNYQIAVML